MSYNKKTWAAKDKITSAALNNIETGVEGATHIHVPFELTVDGQGNMSASTTADYATVRAAAIANVTVIADVTAPGDMLIKAPLWGINPTDLFFAVQIMPNSQATEAQYYSLYWSATQVLFIPKTVNVT